MDPAEPLFTGYPTDLLYSQPLRNELHHLLWITPFDNQGTWDFGWTCRDHAFVTGIISQLLGHTAELVYGEAMFIRGITEDVAGLGVHQRTHAWLTIEGDGMLDISIRLATTDPSWHHPGIEYVARSKCKPTGCVTVSETTTDFDAATFAARYLHGEHAIYRAERSVKIGLHMAMNAFAFINSPLTVRLSKTYPPTIYAQLAVHTFDLLRGRTESLTGLQPDYAWKKISRLHGNAISWLETNGGFR